MSVVTRIFAMVSILYGIVLAFATFAWKLPELGILRAENAIPATFILAAVFYLPFVITFTQLGLNTAEGEEPSPETKKRHSQLATNCPIWPVAWYGALGFVTISFVGFLVFGDTINPFFSLCSSFSSLSGLWFLFVYPKARHQFHTTQNTA